MKYTDYLVPLTDIARRAGEAILEVYDREDFGVKLKSDDSPLTEADANANHVIVLGLQELTPDIPIISEENKLVDYETRKTWSRCWLVDPLDGTKEFIKRNGEFTVNIALVEDGAVTMGVVFVPATNRMYWAARGQGAYEISETENHRLSAARFTAADTGLKIVGSRSHMNDETKNFILAFNQPEIVPKGSSLKFITLAEAEAHIYPRLAPTMEWDTGAAQIVLEEAGGQVIDRETQQPLRYNKENLLNPHFVAYGNLSNDTPTA